MPVSTCRTLRPLLVAAALLPVFLVALSLPARAFTIRYVPAQYTTLQAAINAADIGDLIMVAPGTYSGTGNRDIQLLGKNLVIEASGGSANTTIDCGGSASSDGSGNHRGFYIHQGETSVVLSGFTIQHGYETPVSGVDDTSNGDGGGIYIAGSHVTLQDCVLTDNNARRGDYQVGGGGGIYSAANSVLSMTNCRFVENLVVESGGGLFNGGAAALTGCTFIHNSGLVPNDNDGGGGVYNQFHSTLTLTNCTFTGNSILGSDGHEGSNGNGGALDDNGTATVTGCTFTDNLGYDGAGVSGAQLTLTNCAFVGNKALDNGGGLYTYSSAQIAHCTFTDNTAGGYGGGLSSRGTLTDCILTGNTAQFGGGIEGSATMTDCTLTGNKSTSEGGGLYGGATLTNCTLTGNTAGYQGGGIWVGAGTTATLTNTILYGDTGGEIYTQPQSGSSPAGKAAPSYCDIQGGYTGTGNLNADPLFADPTNGDAHIKTGSPCLGKGTHTGAPATDLDGRTRPNPPSIGAYELAATRTVPAQYSTIQSAVDASLSGDTIVLASGTYTGTGNRDVDLDGKSVTITSQSSATTVIDCGGTDEANHRAFYIHRGETNVFLSNLTIENGYTLNGSSTPDSGYGAGINVQNSGVTLQNCALTDNVAQGEQVADSFYVGGFGGGIYALNGSDGTVSTRRVTLTNTTFTGNDAYSGGGGLCFSGKAVLTGCTFADNSASIAANGEGGGGIDNSGAATLTSCTFTGNTASYGGGLQNKGGDDTVLNGCSFMENTATLGGGIYTNILARDTTITLTACKFLQNTAQYGGGLLNDLNGDDEASGTISAVNCTLFDNTASNGYGGGADNAISGAGGITFTNCTLLQNTAPSGKGGGFYDGNYGGTIALTNDIVYGDTGGETGSEGTAAAVTYSDVQGGLTGAHNLNADPKFVRIPNLSASPPDYGDLRLQPISPCQSAGNHAVAPVTDKGGIVRPNPPSIGAFETLAVLKSLAFSPTTVVGGSANSTGTVTLTQPVSDSTVVSLRSSSTAVLSLRFSTVTIAAGATSATFTAYSHAVTSSTSVTVTGTLGSVSKSATLTVTPLALSSLSLSPTSVIGGSGSSTGTVTLTGTAPSGGTVVSLSSSNTSAAHVPSSVTVSAGATTAMFPITTGASFSTSTVTIGASAGGVTKTQVLTVTSAASSSPVLSSISPTSRTAGGGQFTLTANGSNFISGSIIKWNGSSQRTTFVSSTKLTTTIPASLIASAGTASVTVTTPHVRTSNAITFTITP